MTPNTPLFVKTHDFNLWLIRHTQRFPKHLRHSYTNRLETAALEFERPGPSFHSFSVPFLCVPWRSPRLDQAAGIATGQE